MWYAVETVFIDGNHFDSRPCFEMNVDPNYKGVQPGTCLCSHDEEPHNSCQTFLDGRIEIHLDWFKTKEQAMRFIDGSLTYVIHYENNNKSRFLSFLKWEVINVTDDIQPWRGIYEAHCQ